jgi:hypothetical protein
MFQICQKLRRGFWLLLEVAEAAATDAINGVGFVGNKRAEGYPWLGVENRVAFKFTDVG